MHGRPRASRTHPASLWLQSYTLVSKSAHDASGAARPPTRQSHASGHLHPSQMGRAQALTYRPFRPCTWSTAQTCASFCLLRSASLSTLRCAAQAPARPLPGCKQAHAHAGPVEPAHTDAERAMPGMGATPSVSRQASWNASVASGKRRSERRAVPRRQCACRTVSHHSSQEWTVVK